MAEHDRSADPGAPPPPRRIILERIKHRHTSHWDDDYLGREELETLYIGHAQRARRRKLRQFAWIAFWMALLCLHPTLLYWLRVAFETALG